MTVADDAPFGLPWWLRAIVTAVVVLPGGGMFLLSPIFGPLSLWHASMLDPQGDASFIPDMKTLCANGLALRWWYILELVGFTAMAVTVGMVGFAVAVGAESTSIAVVTLLKALAAAAMGVQGVIVLVGSFWTFEPAAEICARVLSPVWRYLQVMLISCWIASALLLVFLAIRGYVCVETVRDDEGHTDSNITMLDEDMSYEAEPQGAYKRPQQYYARMQPEAG